MEQDKSVNESGAFLESNNQTLGPSAPALSSQTDKRSSVKPTVLSRFPPSEDKNSPPLTNRELFNFDVNEKIQFFEKRNKAVDSARKSIANSVNRSIDGFLDEYSTRIVGSPVPVEMNVENEIPSNEIASFVEVLYRDFKENRPNKMTRKFIRTMAYKIKRIAECSQEEINAINPLFYDVILGFLAKKLLGHKLEEMLGTREMKGRGEELLTFNGYKIRFVWKVTKTNKNDGSDVIEGRRGGKRKRRHSRWEKTGQPNDEDLQESIKELVERKLLGSAGSDAEAKSDTEEVTQDASGISNLMDSHYSSAIKVEDKEMAKINRVSERKTGKIGRKARKVKLKGSPNATKWEKRLMSTFEEPIRSSTTSDHSTAALRLNELKERKEERNRKKRENVDSEP